MLVKRGVNLRLVFLTAVIILDLSIVNSSKKSSKNLIESVADHKDFKKILRTKNNVFVCFSSGAKASSKIIKILEDVAQDVKGLGTILSVDCNGEGKKLCKKLKVSTDTYVLKHFKDGDFHKDYDRSESTQSFITFLKDPTGDLPWEEDPAAADVKHLSSPQQFNKFFKQEKGRVLVMFYAPWCGHCKRMKPDFQSAATELKGVATLAAMDANKPENSPIGKRYNVTGFPTIFFFDEGIMQYTYPGDNNKNSIINFLKDPKPEVEAKPVDVPWADEPSEVVHLTDDTFHDFVSEHGSVLVMFYAPWCGHCKKAKPQFVAAAAKMKEEGIEGKLAGVDCTLESGLATKYEVKGYPTIKYFKNGEMAFDAGQAREEGEILKFMRDPKEPPPPPPPEKPWSEEASEVHHLTEETFKPFLKKKKHVLVMFYAPWCGHCKKAKPEFTAAAADFSDNAKVEFVAVDCTTDNSVCSAYDVRGFPTLKYFHYLNKETKNYDGGRTKKDFVNFMTDPLSPFAGQPPPPPTPEEQWADIDGSLYVKHLRTADFAEYTKHKDTVLVMFYAPWCGHCKKMKPDYAAAARQLTEEGVVHVLAAVDATAETGLGQQYEVRGYPTLKLFRRGVVLEDYNGGRGKKELVEYIRKKAMEAQKDEL